MTTAFQLSCPRDCWHGVCLNGTCVCNSGWSGHVDYYPQDFTAWGGEVMSCPTNLFAVNLIYSIALLASTLLLLVSPLVVRHQWKVYKMRKGSAHTQHWYQHKPLLYLAVGCTFKGPSLIALCLIKLISTEQSEAINVTVQASIAHSIFFPSVIAGCLIFCANLISNIVLRETISSDMRLVKQIIGVSYAGFGLITFSSCLAGLVPVLTLGVVPMEYEETFWLGLKLSCSVQSATGFALTIVSLITAVSVKHAFTAIIKEREALARMASNRDSFASSLEGLRRNRDRIVTVLLTLATAAAASAIFDIICLFVPILRASLSYVKAVQVALAALISLMDYALYSEIRMPSGTLSAIRSLLSGDLELNSPLPRAVTVQGVCARWRSMSSMSTDHSRGSRTRQASDSAPQAGYDSNRSPGGAQTAVMPGVAAAVIPRSQQYFYV
eukprot:6195431-Pleurochrysis_carterae.AAC.1